MPYFFVANLSIFASIPGFTGAACSDPRVGRSLAIGFVAGLSVLLLLRGAVGVVLLLVSVANARSRQRVTLR